VNRRWTDDEQTRVARVNPLSGERLVEGDERTLLMDRDATIISGPRNDGPPSRTTEEYLPLRHRRATGEVTVHWNSEPAATVAVRRVLSRHRRLVLLITALAGLLGASAAAQRRSPSRPPEQTAAPANHGPRAADRAMAPSLETATPAAAAEALLQGDAPAALRRYRFLLSIEPDSAAWQAAVHILSPQEEVSP
jgi:hypothetical protein